MTDVIMLIQVICALETLESLAGHNEKENEEILELQNTVSRLESDKQSRMQERTKFEKVCIFELKKTKPFCSRNLN